LPDIRSYTENGEIQNTMRRGGKGKIDDCGLRIADCGLRIADCEERSDEPNPDFSG